MIFNIESVNMYEWSSRGKLILIGTFSEDIIGNIKTDLPSTYPNFEIKSDFDEELDLNWNKESLNYNEIKIQKIKYSHFFNSNKKINEFCI